MTPNGLGRTALALLEQHLKLLPEDYRDLVRLSAKLREGLTGVLPGTASNYKLRLADVLQEQGRIEDALAVFRADAGWIPDSQVGEETADVGKALRIRLEGEIPRDMAGLYVGNFAATLIDAEEPEQAVVLLEGYTGLTPEDYSGPQAPVARIAELREQWSEPVAATLVSIFLAGLRGMEEEEKAGLIAEAFVDASGRLTDRPGDDYESLPSTLMIYDLWLKRFGRDSGRHPLDVCRDLVRYLRGNLATHGVQLKDRTSLIKITGDLRRRILETGLFWEQRERDAGLAEQISVEVQLWDAELTQRVLVERFLLEPILPVSPGAFPVRNWAGGKDLERPDSASHLPDLDLVRKATGALNERGSGIYASEAPTLEKPTRLLEDRVSLFQKAREVIAQGVDEEKMAEVLGDGSLLLRASFGDEGRLHWSALQSDGRCLRLLGKGDGTPGDLGRLRWAAARHDFRMALARFRARERMPGTVATVLREVRQALDELLFELGSPTMPGYFASRLDWISRRFLSPWVWDTPRLLLPVQGSLQPMPEGEALADWIQDSATQLRDFRDRLAQPAPRSLQEELDRITADYIEEVRQRWDLDGLATVLSPELDLVVQVDDTLHAVPIAHLTVSGEPLFRRVRSIRGSITLLMTSLQIETEKEIGQNATGPERLLSVSHFQPGDIARRGAAWLPHGFSVLAERHGLEAYAAADEPAGSVGLLRTALEDLQRFRVLAICGHGNLFRSGIALQEDGKDFSRLWQGGGCDLSGVDWLWMVSCSIGRLKQSGDLDVEGFCVQLALHRARSVAAFRWPVHSLEAVALVNESVRLYLEALESSAGGDARCLRARALNDARKNFFGDGSRPPLYSQVGLNTAAACELFGLG